MINLANRGQREGGRQWKRGEKDKVKREERRRESETETEREREREREREKGGVKREGNEHGCAQ